MSTTETALTVHLVKPDARVHDDWLAGVSKALPGRFRIDHTTIQVESGRASQPCRRAGEGMV